jgi:serine/threonine protein kinase
MQSLFPINISAALRLCVKIWTSPNLSLGNDPANVNLGRIALSLGLISQDHARLILDEATASQRSFIEIALSRGILSEGDCAKVLHLYSKAQNRLPEPQNPYSGPNSSPDRYLPQPGETIDDYRVIRKLGQGGMGAVYAVEKDRVIYALKIIVGELQLESVERFRREGEAAARVDRHPNIVSIHKMGTFRERPYLVFDFVQGADLASILKRDGRLPADVAVDLLLPVVNAIEFAHRSGVIHRDLKPANVLLRSVENSPLGVPLVADFGLARILSEERMTATGQSLGTPGYMAPEQVEASSTMTHSVDIWALGVILFECIAGRSPFAGETQLSTIHNICVGATPSLLPLLSERDKALDLVVTKCLQKNPATAIRAPRALASDLRAWREGQAVLARPSRSRRKLWLSLAAVALLSAALLLLGKGNRSSEGPPKVALSEELIQRISSRATSQIVQSFFNPGERIDAVPLSEPKSLDLTDPQTFSALLLNSWLSGTTLRADQKSPQALALVALSEWIHRSRESLIDSKEARELLQKAGYESCSRSLELLSLLQSGNEIDFRKLNDLLARPPRPEWHLSLEARRSIAVYLRRAFDHQVFFIAKTASATELASWMKIADSVTRI